MSIRLLGKDKGPKPRKLSDPATLYDVATLVQHNCAPLAVVVQELMQKIARLEDRLGITDETVAAEQAPPVGEPLTPVAQAALRDVQERFGAPDQQSGTEAGAIVLPMNGTGGDLE